LRWPRDTFCPLKFAITSPSGGRSVGIVRLRTKATELVSLFDIDWRVKGRILMVSVHAARTGVTGNACEATLWKVFT
jgi:hypothetical protein